MLKRPLCGMAVCFGAGILLAAYGRERLILPAVCMAVVLTALLFCKRLGAVRAGKGSIWAAARIAFRVLLFAACLCMGGQRYLEHEALREEHLSGLWDGMSLRVQGRLSSKSIREDQYIYILTSNNTDRIMVYSDADDYSIGQTLLIEGTVSFFRKAVNEGNFDEEKYYAAQNIDFCLKHAEVLKAYGRAERLRESLFLLRTRLGEVYMQALGSREGGVLATITVGERTLLDTEVKELYQTAGISHILAISGLHISVIGMGVYRLLHRLRMDCRIAGLISGSLMLCYGVMAGMGTSVQRAVFMFLLSVLARAAGRSYDSMNALGGAALFILWRNPLQAFYAGFLFSFAAVLGAVWISGNEEALAEEGGKRDHKALARLRQTLIASISIQLVTLPLSAWYYFEIPLYAILANAVVLPLTGVVLFCGIVGGIAGLCFTGAAKFLLFPCYLFLQLFERVCTISAGWPGALLVTGRPALWKMLFYYSILGLRTILRRRRRYVQDCRTGLQVCKGPFVRMARVAIPALMLFFLFLRPKGGFELDVLDVGQGDASFLRTSGGDTLFVDGGSSDVSQVGTYRILPFLKAKGIRGIDFWIVSHTDRDHISGLLEVLAENYPVRYIVFSEEISQDEAYTELAGLAQDCGAKLMFLGEGDVLHLGDAKLVVLSPKKGSGAIRQDDKNGASLVVRYEEGDFSGIFTGDIGIEEERELLAEGAIREVDFYKAAHHGSKGSNSEEFLEVLSPSVSVISCALKNSYGHPGEEAVAHMKGAGSAVFYTMYSGQIRLTVKGSRLAAQKYLDPLAEYYFPMVK